MTTHMLDAIESGAMEFIKSLGEEWRPLIDILNRMTKNERRSFCCKILYQRMQEMRLEELVRIANKTKPFHRQTTSLTPEQREKLAVEEAWDDELPENVAAAYFAPKKLHAPYNITVAQLQIRGHYQPPVEFMADFAVRAAYYFGLPCTGPVPLPMRRERWTLIRSPFIFKKVQENYERRTYSRLVTIKDGHPDVVEMWLSYCIQNQFHGTGMKVHMFTQDYVGVGRAMAPDIKKFIETDRWAIDGYNMLRDDAKSLQGTIDLEIKRIESKLKQQDGTERARRVLQQRVSDLLLLEEQVNGEAKQVVSSDDAKAIADSSKEGNELKISSKAEREGKSLTQRYTAMKSLVDRLPKLDVEELEQEVEWDKQQDQALRKHLLHVAMYARQKGVGPLTREELFVYVPFVLLPKYKGIHRDVFGLVQEEDLLRIPKFNTGYLANWDDLTERERYDLVIQHRKPQVNDARYFQGDKMDTSRLSKMLERRQGHRTDVSDLLDLSSDISESQTAARVDECPSQDSDKAANTIITLKQLSDSMDNAGPETNVAHKGLEVDFGSKPESVEDDPRSESHERDADTGAISIQDEALEESVIGKDQNSPKSKS